MIVKRPGRWAVLVCAGVGVFSWSATAALLPGRSAAQSLPESPGKDLPAGPGRDVVESVCSLCHAADAVVGKQWTKTEWEAKVSEMLQEEPDVTAPERAAIVEYLAANFRPGGKIYVNKAAAKDLEAALELSAKDAGAIVEYRKENGVFKTIDDLKRVPGLDGAKVEATKDRLEF